ncbi:MAG: adenylate/guanylate cyclase domain-containing protein, partial [Hyphomicrobiaceae bacterium]
NPQLFALAYTWQRDSDEISEFQATHAGLQTEQFLNSPFAAILRGEGGIRRRLEGENLRLDFPVLQELKDEGITDYVAVPLRFSDGQINILVLYSDAPGGFTTEQLGQLYEVLANLSRLLEAHAQRVSSLTLLQTYLGRDAGQRVIDGLIKRGDGEELNAVIWFSDLRGSTALAETLEREDYLEALNQYFDSVAGAVIEQGGEVLKFIGDAVLAIFAIDEAPNSAGTACDSALAAVKLARKRLGKINAERSGAGQPALAFGTALHVGKLMYGNIGTPRRLDFTVIGPSVNEAARLESMCKDLGQAVIVSEAFAARSSCQLLSLGRHELRDVSQAQELFTLDDVPAA